MGILDDAIREHLELKRSHGASDDEIKRKEAEAFGAARSEAPPADEHTQLLAPDELPDAHPAAIAEMEPLEPAPADPYAVHPGDDLVPDPGQHHPAQPETQHESDMSA